LSEEQKITVEIHYPPVVYKIDVKKGEADKALGQLQAFARNHNKKILEAAGVISKLDPKARSKLLSKKVKTCRMPDWFYKAKKSLAVPDIIALILYFVGEPLTVREVTDIFNNEARSIDLRNVSKYLTSKDKELYGYTSYDEELERYSVNDYGNKWIEGELIPSIRLSLKTKPAAKTKLKAK
jgi:hypothetical protein